MLTLPVRFVIQYITGEYPAVDATPLLIVTRYRFGEPLNIVRSLAVGLLKSIARASTGPPHDVAETLYVGKLLAATHEIGAAPLAYGSFLILNTPCAAMLTDPLTTPTPYIQFPPV
jgi:hypothetical protein